MKRFTPAAALATASAVVAVSIIAATAGGQAPEGRTLTLISVAKGATFGLADNPPKTTFTSEGEPRRLSVGDVETFSLPVTDQKGNRLGRINGHCVIVKPGKAHNHEEYCAVAYRLKGGVITAATGLLGDTGKVSAAVTGGTGAYEGARGSLISVTAKNGNSTDTIHLLP
jgi:hypothetical protein